MRFAILGAIFVSLLVELATADDARGDYVRRARGSEAERRWSPVRGLYVGAGAAGTWVLHQSGEPDLMGTGAGAAIYAGLRLHPVLGVELGWLGSLHEPNAEAFGADADLATMHGLSADVRIYPGGEAALEPYAQGGLGVYLVDDAILGFEATGTGFHVGGGADWKLARHVALTLRTLYRGLSLRPPHDDRDNVFVSAVSLEAGLALRF